MKVAPAADSSGLVISILFPDTATMLALVGWELGSSIEGIADVPANVVALVNELITEQLGDWGVNDNVKSSTLNDSRQSAQRLQSMQYDADTGRACGRCLMD